MLSGDNGILQKATTVKENTDKAQITERIQLAYHSALTGGQGSYTKESLEDELEKEFGEEFEEVDDSNDTNWILKAKGQSVTIPAGKVDGKKVIIKVGTTNLKEVQNLSTLYGETTDYISIAGINWQLFYDDDDYIYLITSDYAPISTLESELCLNDENDCTAWFSTGWNNSTSSYEGTIMNANPWSSGKEASVLISNPLTNKYLRWIGSGVDTGASDNENMRAVAYMMDTSKWSDFAGEAKGAFAMGGPTLEMFVASYNAKTPRATTLGTYETINSTNANEIGYKVKKASGSWDSYCGGLSNTSNMWILKGNTKAYAYWIASPSIYASSWMYMVDNNGNIDENYIGPCNLGFRPLIAIPKSSLK